MARHLKKQIRGQGHFDGIGHKPTKEPPDGLKNLKEGGRTAERKQSYCTRRPKGTAYGVLAREPPTEKWEGV